MYLHCCKQAEPSDDITTKPVFEIIQNRALITNLLCTVAILCFCLNGFHQRRYDTAATYLGR